MTLDPQIAARLKRDSRGLVAAVALQRGSGRVLMVAWMDDEALARTLATRRATYHSVRLDCDGDTVLLEVDQAGPACHTGTDTCFDADLLLGPE
jgi:phosphoribosyl-AMP cyclohydrolase